MGFKFQSKPSKAVSGGSTKMFTEREAGPQKPGMTSSAGQDGPETNFAVGGKTKMFGFTGSKPAQPR